eukprot:CAMPEP_0198325312 /NCGR_PEP_ID=MMETSP1450-20131203/13082_1 /TAXON_ID=753684 ORGANISM="Madagascaria erythrocladiodes, Strain CCMP3234" /NCGR_SAMPLE_ID=MMETSP1450 /ASSEMBLY_ACC=CAM_ASM_001115 /LENGTH=544 /DNA_ID=CAMNT_0044029181 /DNA_START=184 /DNA_END=1818 /DNA_ORIENTATION=-
MLFSLKREYRSQRFFASSNKATARQQSSNVVYLFLLLVSATCVVGDDCLGAEGDEGFSGHLSPNQRFQGALGSAVRIDAEGAAGVGQIVHAKSTKPLGQTYRAALDFGDCRNRRDDYCSAAILPGAGGTEMAYSLVFYNSSTDETKDIRARAVQTQYACLCLTVECNNAHLLLPVSVSTGEGTKNTCLVLIDGGQGDPGFAVQCSSPAVRVSPVEFEREAFENAKLWEYTVLDNNEQVHWSANGFTGRRMQYTEEEFNRLQVVSMESLRSTNTLPIESHRTFLRFGSDERSENISNACGHLLEAGMRAGFLDRSQQDERATVETGTEASLLSSRAERPMMYEAFFAFTIGLLGTSLLTVRYGANQKTWLPAGPRTEKTGVSLFDLRGNSAPAIGEEAPDAPDRESALSNDACAELHVSSFLDPRSFRFWSVVVYGLGFTTQLMVVLAENSFVSWWSNFAEIDVSLALNRHISSNWTQNCATAKDSFLIVTTLTGQAWSNVEKGRLWLYILFAVFGFIIHVALLVFTVCGENLNRRRPKTADEEL